MQAKEIGGVVATVLGLGVIAAVPLALNGGPWLTLLVLATGLGLILFRVWGKQRTYLALRREVYAFHRLVRELNAAALQIRERDSAEARRRLEDTRRAMRESVDRMVEVAGKREEDLEAESAERA